MIVFMDMEKFTHDANEAERGPERVHKKPLLGKLKTLFVAGGALVSGACEPDRGDEAMDPNSQDSKPRIEHVEEEHGEAKKELMNMISAISGGEFMKEADGSVFVLVSGKYFKLSPEDIANLEEYVINQYLDKRMSDPRFSRPIFNEVQEEIQEAIRLGEIGEQVKAEDLPERFEDKRGAMEDLRRQLDVNGETGPPDPSTKNRVLPKTQTSDVIKDF